jgi:ribosome recycling factor
MLENAKKRMEKTINILDKQFSSIHTLDKVISVDSIKVNHCGSLVSLLRLARINIPHRYLAIINPHDPSYCSDIEVAVQSVDSSFVTIKENNIIRLCVPITADLLGKSQDRELHKAHQIAEDGRVAIRNVRRDVKRFIDKNLPEDEARLKRDELQELTNDHIRKIDNLVRQKQIELAG